MIGPRTDTVAAIATAAGGGIGIVRISGPEALAVAARIFRDRAGRPIGAAPAFRLVLGTVAEPDTADPLDEALAVHMPAGRSYTGESTVEIQAHGGRAVLEAVLQAAIAAGARQALPGEFTRRAHLAGRLDLAQAEAVAALVGAEDDAERRGALRQLAGAVAAEIHPLRERLLDLAARLEAALDLDSEEVPGDIPEGAEVRALADDLRKLAARGKGSCGRRGATVVLAGRPNSGKSSIFNKLLDNDRSIVSRFPGTTRDYVAERTDLGGSSVTLIDTAGFCRSENAVEAEGVRRSIERVGTADIVVLVQDGSVPDHPDDAALLELASGRSPLIVVSKSDLQLELELDVLRQRCSGLPLFCVSVLQDESFPPFAAALASRCRAVNQPMPAESSLNPRHCDALVRAAGFLDTAALCLGHREGQVDLGAVELRAALDAFGEITGETAREEVLERVFTHFCVGK